MKSSLLKSGFPPNAAHEMLLSQEAINLGIKELLKGGMSEGDFLRQLDNLDFETTKRILTEHISEENQVEIVFSAK